MFPTKSYNGRSNSIEGLHGQGQGKLDLVTKNVLADPVQTLFPMDETRLTINRNLAESYKVDVPENPPSTVHRKYDRSAIKI